MKLKSGVSYIGIQPETIMGILVAEDFFKTLNQEFVVTSICDGLHKENSLHYQGYAFDLRIWGLKGICSAEMCDRLREALGGHYDVILEPSHIHVEFDP